MTRTIAFSSYNAETHNGAKEHMIWMHRDNGTSRALGVAAKARWGAWTATIAGPDDRTRNLEYRTLRELRDYVKALWS